MKRIASILAFLTVWSTAMAAEPMTNRRSFRLDAPCAQVFPLFTAEGEKRWAPGWDPQMLSGDTARGTVFKTVSHRDARETVWIVTAYEPEHHRVSYARIAQGSNTGLVDVVCAPSGQGAEISVRYTLTGLDAPGAEFVREFLSDARYSDFIEEWRVALVKALAQS
ncbi:MAG TPA: SRPBCC family protein [Luteimonas sp.]|nr:SRPBCC family protein [Luteimonas sp.]